MRGGASDNCIFQNTKHLWIPKSASTTLHFIALYNTLMCDKKHNSQDWIWCVNFTTYTHYIKFHATLHRATSEQKGYECSILSLVVINKIKCPAMSTWILIEKLSWNKWKVYEEYVEVAKWRGCRDQIAPKYVDATRHGAHV